MSLGENIAFFRNRMNLTQEQLAEKLNVSCQSIIRWESEGSIDSHQLIPLADALCTTVDALIRGGSRSEMRVRIFDENRMRTDVKTKAAALGLNGTLAALDFACEQHKHQTRKNAWGGERIPYINHPLTMACQAMAMGITDDEILAAVLLHDVYEDTGVALDDIPCTENVREAVRLLSHNSYAGPAEISEAMYYAGIAKNPIAALVKCIDRCNNLSGMSTGFTNSKMRSYIEDTEKYVLPILESLTALEPAYSNCAWLLKYQIYSLLEMAKRFL